LVDLINICYTPVYYIFFSAVVPEEIIQYILSSKRYNMSNTNLLEILELPVSIQRIVDGVGAENVVCSQCRKPDATLRCSRCQVAKYCSVSCQYFFVHKIFLLTGAHDMFNIVLTICCTSLFCGA